MLSPVDAQDTTGGPREAARAFRTILDWLGRSRTRTLAVEVRCFGRELFRLEIDRGKC